MARGLFYSVSFYRWNTLSLGHFIADCRVISLLQYALYYVDVSAIGSVFGPPHNISPILGPRYKKRANSSKTSPITFGPCFKPIVEFQFRPPTQPKSHLSKGKLFHLRQLLNTKTKESRINES